MHHRALCSSSSRLGTHDETCAEEVLVKPWSSTWRHENSGECRHHQIQKFKNKHLEMISQCGGISTGEYHTGEGDQAHRPSGDGNGFPTQVRRPESHARKAAWHQQNYWDVLTPQNFWKSWKQWHQKPKNLSCPLKQTVTHTHININTHAHAHRRKECEHLLFNGILKLACHHCLPKVFTLATMFRMWSVETFS